MTSLENAGTQIEVAACEYHKRRADGPRGHANHFKIVEYRTQCHPFDGVEHRARFQQRLSLKRLHFVHLPNVLFDSFGKGKSESVRLRARKEMVSALFRHCDKRVRNN
jgi:hypothetical protein